MAGWGFDVPHKTTQSRKACIYVPTIRRKGSVWTT
jgi:hypothetical protein